MSKRGRLLIGCAALVAAAPLQQQTTQTNYVPISNTLEDHVDISIDNNRYQHDADNRRRRHKRRRRRVQVDDSVLEEGGNDFNINHHQQQYRRLKDDNKDSELGVNGNDLFLKYTDTPSVPLLVEKISEMAFNSSVIIGNILPNSKEVHDER